MSERTIPHRLRRSPLYTRGPLRRATDSRPYERTIEYVGATIGRPSKQRRQPIDNAVDYACGSAVGDDGAGDFEDVGADT